MCIDRHTLILFRGMSGMHDGIIPELTERLKGLTGSVICFSGGLDSTVLLRNALEADPDGFVAVFAELPMTTVRQKDAARRIALSLGTQAEEVRIWWDALGEVRSNGPDRCYHCKRAIYMHARKIADNLGFVNVLCGDNADDGIRPGTRAADELNVISPLSELGIGRDTVIKALESMELPVRIFKDTCLATRYPEGERLTDGMLRFAEGCESIVRTITDVGLLRVRLDADGNALIQTDPDEIERVEHHLKEIESSFILKGIKKTEIDKNGYNECNKRRLNRSSLQGDRLL